LKLRVFSMALMLVGSSTMQIVLIAGGVGAVGAGVDVGDVVADGAEAEVLLEGGDGGGEVLGVGVRGAQDVEGIALRGLGADAGQLAEFVDEPGHGRGEAGGHGATPCREGR
jgi:hypothetical protein